MVFASSGALARSFRDIDLFSKVVIDTQPWIVDPGLVPLPWTPSNSVTLPKKLRVGVIVDDGVVRPTASVQRAIQYATERLRGHAAIELVDFVPFKHADGIAIAVRLPVSQLHLQAPF